MSNGIYRSETLRLDPYQTNGTAGGRMVECSVSAFDSGSVQLHIDTGPAHVFIYPTSLDLRRLGDFLIAAADRCEAALESQAASATMEAA